jgi:hypothetical protein
MVVFWLVLGLIAASFIFGMLLKNKVIRLFSNLWNKIKSIFNKVEE